MIAIADTGAGHLIGFACRPEGDAADVQREEREAGKSAPARTGHVAALLSRARIAPKIEVQPETSAARDKAREEDTKVLRMSSFQFVIAALSLLMLSIVGLCPRTAHAETPELITPLEYAVKFVCGESGESEGRVVAPGAYFTAINVHNPNERGIGFKKKFAIALPGERPGPVSEFFDAELGPDQAFEIDCPDILRRTGTKGGFLKGFVVIESALELDVVAVYTAAGATSRVETMELERVKPRRQGAEGKPDLIPVPDPKLGFCRRQNLKLTVTVKNQGSTDAGPSITTVDFGTAGIASQPTPALAAGASINLLFDIPAACFNPDCEFKITVDSNDQVNESNEGNNADRGKCLG